MPKAPRHTGGGTRLSTYLEEARAAHQVIGRNIAELRGDLRGEMAKLDAKVDDVRQQIHAVDARVARIEGRFAGSNEQEA